MNLNKLLNKNDQEFPCMENLDRFLLFVRLSYKASF